MRRFPFDLFDPWNLNFRSFWTGYWSLVFAPEQPVFSDLGLAVVAAAPVVFDLLFVVDPFFFC